MSRRWKRLRLAVVNVDNGTASPVIAGYVRALTEFSDCDIVIGVETVGNGSIRVPGTRTVENLSSRSTKNVRVWLDDNLPEPRVSWWRGKQTWPRKDHPGQSDPRAIVRATVGRMRIFAGHFPPSSGGGFKGTEPARDEMLDEAVSWTDVERPRVSAATWTRRNRHPVFFGMDSNGMAPELAKRARFRVVGNGGPTPERILYRGAVRPRGHQWTADLGGVVRFRGDHHKVLIADFDVRSKYLTDQPRRPRKEWEPA